MGGFTRAQQALQLYTPLTARPELDWLHEDIEAAKDDLYLAMSLGTGRGVAPGLVSFNKGFVSFSGAECTLSNFALPAFVGLADRSIEVVFLVATVDGVGREHSLCR